ncbi:hypothetical protein THRCLA_01963 [Thraustotheca clavata]|uniref:HORMA domain-containing protein n=1 Tax=Thraustotheca clavata TaxID=74557 RepID=A0A1W0A7F8_9STRA|nr:hypothetical protein THRCLA_01963 [Thraustotheca clavata]
MNDMVNCLIEFLEVGIHEFMYFYPQIFYVCKKYDVPVHACRHPLLHEYIHDMLDTCRVLIAQGRVEKLSVGIFASTGELLDTCVFEIGLNAGVLKRTLEESFRKALVQLCSASSLVVNPPGEPYQKSFRLFLDTIEESIAPETLVNEQTTANSWVLTEEPSSGVLYPIASNEASMPIHFNIYLIRPINPSGI